MADDRKPPTHSDRDKRDRIERLRTRLGAIRTPSRDDPAEQLRAVIKGILDLLEDEL